MLGCRKELVALERAVRPWIVGHRGCAGLAPENTLAAFRRAVELGVDAIECDVHLTADGRLAVIHDGRTDRTTGTPGRIAELTMDRLRAMDAGQGQPIPELAEVLAVTAAAGVHAVIELKALGTPAPALAAVAARPQPGGVTYISFDLELLEEVRRLDPSARTGTLFSRPGQDAAARTREVGAQVLDVHFATLTPELVDQTRSAGLVLWVWTPNSDGELRQALAAAPDGITTDYPDRLLALV